jgi:hypothetical protein
MGDRQPFLIVAAKRMRTIYRNIQRENIPSSASGSSSGLLSRSSSCECRLATSVSMSSHVLTVAGSSVESLMSLRVLEERELIGTVIALALRVMAFLTVVAFCERDADDRDNLLRGSWGIVGRLDRKKQYMSV